MNLLRHLRNAMGIAYPVARFAALLGTASRVSEVLSGKRELSMSMVKRLRERFHISADVLIPRERTRRRLAA
jgi:HTH-type transcriptional regulator/antitoxin HigA